MANEFARNQQDQLVKAAPFALPAAASTSTSSGVLDFGLDLYKPQEVDVEIAVPALSTTIVPDTRTVTLVIETSTTSNFAAVSRIIGSRTFTGAGGAGIASGAKLRARLPADCERYVRGTVTFGASTTTGAALSATFNALF